MKSLFKKVKENSHANSHFLHYQAYWSFWLLLKRGQNCKAGEFTFWVLLEWKQGSKYPYNVACSIIISVSKCNRLSVYICSCKVSVKSFYLGWREIACIFETHFQWQQWQSPFAPACFSLRYEAGFLLQHAVSFKFSHAFTEAYVKATEAMHWHISWWLLKTHDFLQQHRITEYNI